ncbi:hypothetical protein M9978_15010 [Sphingomonas sp. MG17]|uniref:Lipoprotein n=1 Tax=Sphingomonas tagetis TaxID=2949092 RepID=A0A9X2HSD9_9SPHN|nr:hypothetical protein [Sphingomonas tagetis]MCP3731735.1 hypothetical protein [Sphingomonas tagetis]
MRWLVLGAAAMLAACGGAPAGNETAKAEGAQPGPEAPIDPAHVKCDQRPDFVVLRPDAQIQSCTSGKGPSPRRESGTVIYLTADKAADVTAWYREQAKAFGMQDALIADTPSPIYSAKDGTKRNFMVLTEAVGARTKITLNWGRDG